VANELKLTDGSRIAVIGGGPAGSFFSYFALSMAERMGLDIALDIYESRDYSSPGPPGCNMCGGIISETLVQMLATEGIDLPPVVVQRGVDSYLLHMDVGSVRINTPLQEKRIGAVHRGAGPKGMQEAKWLSFDGFLLSLANDKGAQIIQGRVDEVAWENGRPKLKTKTGSFEEYDLLAVTTGVNSATLKLFEEMSLGYKAPEAAKTFICEYYLGEETVEKYLGTSMHTFLLKIPRLEFAAIIPKGDYATVCMLGKKIDKELVDTFLNTPEVKQVFPEKWQPQGEACRCFPKMYLRGAKQPYADRLVFIGDSGISRLYKDGIGAAYRTAKAAATTVVFEGISKQDLKKHYMQACNRMDTDNKIGALIFKVVHIIQQMRFSRRGILRMVATEQTKDGKKRMMSLVLWDMFTGSAPYKEVFIRTFHPYFIGGLIKNLLIGIWPSKKAQHKEESWQQEP
jgi:flavin-dependent dehydrogenase